MGEQLDVESIAASTKRYKATGMQRHGASRSRFFFWGSKSLDSQRPRLKGAGDVLRQRHPLSGWPWRRGWGAFYGDLLAGTLELLAPQ